MPQTRRVGAAFKHFLLHLASEGTALLVHQEAHASVACHGEELVIGPFHPTAGGRSLVVFETGGVPSHALTDTTIINPGFVGGRRVRRDVVAFAVEALLTRPKLACSPAPRVELVLR